MRGVSGASAACRQAALCLEAAAAALVATAGVASTAAQGMQQQQLPGGGGAMGRIVRLRPILERTAAQARLVHNPPFIQPAAASTHIIVVSDPRLEGSHAAARCCCAIILILTQVRHAAKRRGMCMCVSVDASPRLSAMAFAADPDRLEQALEECAPSGGGESCRPRGCRCFVV